jgi:two-component system response regulator DesR
MNASGPSATMFAMATVLLVDDDAPYRRALRAFLDASHDVDVVADTGSAEEALALAHELRPDAAVVDVAIPGTNGVDVAQRLRDALPEIEIVLVTGNVGGVDPERARELGSPVLHKGDPLTVENALRALTRRSRP